MNVVLRVCLEYIILLIRILEARMSDKEKFKMTKEEAEKLTKAMEKPEFRDLLFDYVKEIQDPANRAQYESDLKKYEEQLEGFIT